MHDTPAALAPALAIDAGGTAWRWALAGPGGALVAEGALPALPGGWAGQADAPQRLAEVLAPWRVALLPWREAAGWPHAPVAGTPVAPRLWAGFTGVDAGLAPRLAPVLAEAAGVAAGDLWIDSDIAFACRTCFAPGEGHLLLAGTGAVAGHLDGGSRLHRAGGRGVHLDDAGGGHWIAVQALRLVWRDEDAEPGAWRRSPLAVALFDRLGGADWALTRRFMAEADRGEVGRLALAVAEAARAGDTRALALLHQVGAELARLVHALDGRCGRRPLALAGRVWDLHPAVEAGLRAALPDARPVTRVTQPLHRLAAARAAGGATTPGALEPTA